MGTSELERLFNTTQLQLDLFNMYADNHKQISHNIFRRADSEMESGGVAGSTVLNYTGVLEGVASWLAMANHLYSIVPE